MVITHDRAVALVRACIQISIMSPPEAKQWCCFKALTEFRSQNGHTQVKERTTRIRKGGGVAVHNLPKNTPLCLGPCG